VGRNDPCLCGSGRKAKYCCSAGAGVTGGDDVQFLAELSKRELNELNQRCEDCQMEVWFDVLDLPDCEEACRLIVPGSRRACVAALRDALDRGDPDAVADELPDVLEAVDCPAARASMAREVLDLEAAGRVRPVVAEAAIADLAGGRPSLLLIAALLSGLSGEVGVRPIRLASLKQAVRAGRLFRPQGRAVRCRRKSAARGRQ
jgi:hypothetical protein